jgi:hypothetical protein
MSKFRVSCFVLFVILSLMSRGQRIENVDFTTSNGLLIVSYDLVGSPKNVMYDVKLVVKTETGDIDPYTIYGDVKYVSEGTGKKIEWKVANDKVELKGKIQVIVKIVETHSTRIVGGPSCAFLSGMLPGLGDHFVNPGPLGYLVSGLFVGSAYLTISAAGNAQGYYRQYKDADEQEDMDKYYDEAISSQKNFQVLAGITGVIWAADIIYVTIKGFSNKKKQKEELAQKSKKVHLTFSGTKNNLQIGFIKKF